MIRLSDLPIDAPRRPTCVVTLAAGPVGGALLRLSGPGFAEYAERIGSDYRVIAPANPGRYPLVWKWALGRFLAVYDRVIFFDADVLLERDAPNLFDVVPPTAFGAHDDWKLCHSLEWLRKEYRQLAEDIRHPLPPPATCLNTGVMVLSRAHAGAFDPPGYDFHVTHCVEQNITNFNVQRLGFEVYRLPRVLSWLYYADKRQRLTQGVKVWHYAGCGPRLRQELMADRRNRINGTPPSLCVYEAEVIERCSKCGPAADLNHVRYCEHPDNPSERCTRGPNNGAVWSCVTCPHRASHRPAASSQPATSA